MPLSRPSAAMWVNGDVVSTPLKSNKTASMDDSGSACVLVGDGEPAVLAERLRRHTNTDRGLPALPLGDVYQASDPMHEHRVEAEVDELGAGHVALDVRSEDGIEQLVGRQVLVVALTRRQLRARGLAEHG